MSTDMTSSVTSLTIDLPEVVPERAQPIVPDLLNRRTGALVSVAIAAVAGSSLASAGDQAKYEGKLQLRVEPDSGENQPQQAPATQTKISAPTIDYATQIEVLWSPKLLSPVVEQLRTQYPDLSYDSLKRNLDISHSEGAKTLEVTYQDSDSQKTQVVLEQVSQAYLNYSQECRTSLCRELKFIENRLPQLKRQTVTAQRNLQAFQQQHSLTTPEKLGQQLSQRRHVLAQQQQDLQIQLAEAQTTAAIAQKRLAVPNDSLMQMLRQNSPYQERLQQFQATAIQLSEEMGRSQPNSAILNALRQQYQQRSVELAQAARQPLVDRLAAATANSEVNYSTVAQLETLTAWVTAANQVQMLETSQQAIAQAETALTQQIKQWASLARQYDELQLELRFATDNLNQYLTKQAELRTVVQPDLSWKVTAAPQVEQISANEFSISDAQRDFGLGTVLCFLLVIWVMSIGKETIQPKSPTPAMRPDRHPRLGWQTITVEPIPVLQPITIRSNVNSYLSHSQITLLKAALYTQAKAVPYRSTPSG